MKPVVLPPNVLRHFYAGGERIAALRGIELPGDHMPEEWIGAVNTTFGDATRGLSVLPDGTYLRDAIAADPEAWLGPEHVARWGADPALLTKLLDAGQRLPVHFHPGTRFGAEHLGLTHGKTESWLILDADPDAKVWAGFAEPVELETVRAWMRDQDSDALLGALREIPVQAGDAIFVPAGTPHAIGGGILLVELQEPTDLSVMLEWAPFGLTEDEGRLGLAWDDALTALDRTGWDDDRLAAITSGGSGGSLLPTDADPYFRADRVTGGDRLEPGFAVLVVTDGEGTLGDLAIRRGDAVLVPYSAGPTELRGDVSAIRARPPAPDAPEGRW